MNMIFSLMSLNFDLLFQNIIFKVRASFFDSFQHVIFMVKPIWFNVSEKLLIQENFSENFAYVLNEWSLSGC